MEINFLAKNLAFLRKHYGITQTEIEAGKGIKRRNWSNWENKVSEPDFANLIDIGNLFGIPLDWLLKIDLAEKVHLLKEIPDEIEGLKSTSKGTSTNTSNVLNEGQESYIKTPKPVADFQVLEAIKELTNEVKKISENLQQKGN